MITCDTHCHIDLCLEKGGTSFDDFMASLQPMPDLIVQVACHPDNFAGTLPMLAHPNVYGAFGVHPHEASLYSEAVEKELLNHLQHPKAIAFGEMGLDYHYDFSPRPEQKSVFARQLKLALQLQKPIVLHTREADADTLEILKAAPLKGAKIHVHCYTGSLAFAQELLKLDAEVYFGFTGILTFKTGQEIRDVAAAVPMNRILTETDSPFLAPIPFRGKQATPAMVGYVLEALAKVREMDAQSLGQICRENARRFYGV